MSPVISACARWGGVARRYCSTASRCFSAWCLDQGFYPDGIYTAPTDDALRGDIELSMAMGFNGARLHQKVFEPRFLYWADTLGYLVWGEMASWGFDHGNAEAGQRFVDEWQEVLAARLQPPGHRRLVPLQRDLGRALRRNSSRRSIA